MESSSDTTATSFYKLCNLSDSSVNSRESAAVLEFLSLGGASFHSMRDNPAHVVDVMGGMWGAKVGAIRGEMAAAFRAMAGDVNARGKWAERDVDQARMQTAFWGKKKTRHLCREKKVTQRTCAPSAQVMIHFQCFFLAFLECP